MNCQPSLQGTSHITFAIETGTTARRVTFKVFPGNLVRCASPCNRQGIAV